MFFVPSRRKQLNLLVPLSHFHLQNNLMKITKSLGDLLHASSSFRVSNIYILRDLKGLNTERTIRDIYNYMILPPYAKRTIPKKNSLRYVGILPPLDLPLHSREPVPVEGEIRLNLANAGLPPELSGSTKKTDKYVVIIDSERVKLSKYEGPLPYLGPSLKFLDNIGETNTRLVVGSRSGTKFSEVSTEISKEYEERGISLAVGSFKGDFIKSLGKDVEKAILVNGVPLQGVRNLRTEEAVIALLSLISTVISD